MNENQDKADEKSVTTPEIDTDAIAEKAAQSVQERLEADFEKRLAEVEAAATEKATKDIAEKIIGKAEPEEYRPKTWQQIKDDAVAEAEARIEAKTKAEREAEAKNKADSEKASAEKEKELHKYWDSQIKAMTDDGRLPPVDEAIATKLQKGEQLTEEERNHPSLQARAKIYQLAKEHNEPNLELVFFKHLKSNTTPPGMAAPVGGTTRSNNSWSKPDYTYEEIHNSSLEDLAKEAFSGE